MPSKKPEEKTPVPEKKTPVPEKKAVMCPILTGDSGKFRACVKEACALYNADVGRCGYGAFNIPPVSV